MNLKDVFLAVLITIIWGFNFVVIKAGLGSFPPILFSALRFICSAFPAILFVQRNNIGWRWILSVGFFLGILMFSFLFIGMSVGMPAGLSSLILQVQALFTSWLAALILKDSPSIWQKAGTIIAFVGIGLIASDMYHSASFAGLVLVLFAGLSWAIANIIIKIAGDIDMFRLIVWISIIPPIPLIGFSFLFEKGQVDALLNITWQSAGIVIYTALVSTVFAFSIWGKLFRKYSPNVVAPFSMLVPIFGMFFSSLLLNETFSAIKLIASFLVILGLFIGVVGNKIRCFPLSIFERTSR